MPEGGEEKKISRYILLGSFFGSLVGATIAIVAFPESKEEKKKQLKELQRDLLKPVQLKLAELIENLGDTLKSSIEEASKK